MLAGVEVRVPFLDHRLVELCAGIGAARRRTLFSDKRLLRVDDIGVESIGDGSYTLAAHVWVKRPDEKAVKYNLNRTVKEEFERRAPKAAPAAVERRAG